MTCRDVAWILSDSRSGKGVCGVSQGDEKMAMFDTGNGLVRGGGRTTFRGKWRWGVIQ